MEAAEQHFELSPSAERIVDAATVLFAERGFQGVTTRELARAAGLNVATIHHHVGTKRELYLKVLHRLHAQDRAMIDAFLAGLDPSTTDSPERLRDVLLRLLDVLLERTREHPERLRLYVRRWLEPKDELTKTESELSLSLYRPVADLLSNARGEGAIAFQGDIMIFLRSFDWLIYGYFVGGPMRTDTLRGDPMDSENLARFRSYLHDYLCRMLGLPDEPTGDAD